MAVLKKPSREPGNTAESIGERDLAGKIREKLEQGLAGDAAVASKPTLKARRSAPKMEPRPITREDGEKEASTLCAGFRPISFIQRKCQEIPSLMNPLAILKKRSCDKGIQRSGATETASPEPQALFAEKRSVSLEAKAALFETETIPFEAQAPFVELETISFGQERPAPEIKPVPLEKMIATDDDPQTIREAGSSRPLDQARAGYVSPSYTMSRTVKLNPQVMLAKRCVGYQQNSPELDFYRVLRTQILQRSRGGGNTVMVTSAHAGEGKTLTAINLAFTFAKEFKQTALLVDCDLRRQEIHKVLGYRSDKGLADYLLDDCPVKDLFVWPGVEKLTVISGGKTVGESSELLGSPGMKNLVAEMKDRYPERYVIFDVPPLLTSADPLAFAPLVDHIIVTVQAGQTPLRDLNRALSLLPGDKVLGLVLNRQRQVLKPYTSQVSMKTEG